MSQHDFTIDNQTAPAFRTDLNNALQALATLSSGATAPSSTFANMLWYDTANNILKMRAEADDAWISIAYLDQTTDAFRILDDTQVVNTSGTQTGLLGDQATATWETGTGTTESLVSPAKIKAAIDALSTTDVGAATAALSVGVVGTYAFLKGPTTAFGSTQSGANLAYAYIQDDNSNQVVGGTSPSGTWRCMGVIGGVTGDRATLWLRIS